jgi:hypothetical protein
MRTTLIVAALVLLSALAVAPEAAATPCDPDTLIFNECGFNCQPNDAVCQNAVRVGACVMLTVHNRVC